MAHPEQYDFCRGILNAMPKMKSNVSVLDVGSLDINGNNRGLFLLPFEYTGIDVAPGKNVDVVCLGHEFRGGPFDVVISTECLEHDPYYINTMANMYALLRQGGLLMMTAATIGRPEHGTARTTPEDSPLTQGLWPNYYRPITLRDISEVWQQNLFESIGIVIGNPGDIKFYGVKK